MIITRLTADNLYSFQDFELDLTYPRKNSQSFIDYEYLENIPSFKFKRVCILMGTNASGKTSLGKLLLDIQWIMNKRDPRVIHESFLDAICDKEKNANFTVEFVVPASKTYNSLSIVFNIKGEIIDFNFSSIDLKENDTNKTAQTRLNIQKNDKQSIETCVDKFLSHRNQKIVGYYYVLAKNHNDDFNIGKNIEQNIDVLLKILQTFDSSITDVNPLVTERKDEEKRFEGYTVSFENGDSVMVTDNGETFTEKGKNRFSKGTYDVLSISDFLFSVLGTSKKEVSLTYFLDEKLASSHSELEISILNLIITKLNRYSQFFYTTHNYDVLDLNLPSHSFVFLHKEHGYTKVEQPEKLGFSKNDRKLKGHVRNDYFRTIPSTSAIDGLMWGD